MDNVSGDPAATSSTSSVPLKLATRPEELKQLNDSVWEFYKPPYRDQIPTMEIVFFHGAQLSNDKEAFWKTWLSRDETIVWPTVWLAQKFPAARMLFISYDSSVVKSSGQKDTYLTLENLMQDVVWSSDCKAGQSCPVIFVGHCFGGIIIKNFLLNCHAFPTERNQENSHVKEMKMFLQNCKAIFFYSTPNGGSYLMDGLAYRDYILGNIYQPVVGFLEILSKDTARINSKFSILRHNHRLATRGIGETFETNLRGFTKTMVVPEASARQDLDHFYSASTDHFEVSRAVNSKCVIFTMLCDLVAEQVKIASSDISTELRSALHFSADEHYVPLENTIHQIDGAFENSGLVLLHGDSGMGKSSLARHFALRFVEKQAQEASTIGSKPGSPLGPAVVFVTCGQDAKIIDVQEELLADFKAEYPRKDWSKLKETILQKLLRGKLKSHIEDRQALVILDDVWEKKLIENVLVRGRKLKYLITCRNRDLWRHNAEVIGIDGVDMKHGRRILASYAKCKDSDLFEGQADELIKKVDFHPLALASLGTVLQTKKRQSVRDWQDLKRNFLDYLTYDDDDSYYPTLFDEGYPRSLYAAMMLVVNELDDASRTLLHVINIFAGKRIPKSVVELFLSATRPDIFRRFHLTIEKLERLSLVRREAGVLRQHHRVDQSSDDFVIHDLRRKFLSQDESSTNEILSFLSEDRKSDPNRRSKYELAKILCAVCGGNFVTERARTSLPSPNCLWSDKFFMQQFGTFMRGNVFSKLVSSAEEQTSNSTATIEVLSTFVLDHKIDLDNMSVRFMTPEFNTCAFELVYHLLHLSRSLVAGRSVVAIHGPYSESTRTIFINIGGSLERLIQVLSSNAGSKFKTVALLSIIDDLIHYSIAFPERLVTADLISRMATTSLLDMLFVYLDKIDGRHNRRCRQSLIILKAFLDVSPHDLPGTALDNLVAKITSADNLHVLARLVIRGPQKLIDQTMEILRAILGWGDEKPYVGEELVKNAMQNLLETTRLCEAILKRYFLPHPEEEKDAKVDVDADKGVAVDRKDVLPHIERQDAEEALDWDGWTVKDERRKFAVHKAALAIVEFAATHVSNRLLDRTIMRLMQDVETRRGEIASFVEGIAQVPRLASMIVNQDLHVSCLDKLVGLLDDTMEEKFQVSALRALYKLTDADANASTPDHGIQVKMMEVEHLLERVTVFLSERPDMKARCVWAAYLLRRLVSIGDPRTLQGPIVLALSSKAQHLNMCLQRVGNLVVERRSRVIGLDILLSIARLAFNFTESGNSILIDGLAISDVLTRAVILLLSDLETNQINEFVTGLKSVAIIAKFRFDERLRPEVEIHMQRLTTPDLLEKLAILMSRVSVRRISEDDSCQLAAETIHTLATVPALGEFIGRFHDGSGLIIERLLGLLEDLPMSNIEIVGKTHVLILRSIAVKALILLPVRRHEVETRLQNRPIALESLCGLYSRWAWKHAMEGDHQSALEDLDRGLESAYEFRNQRERRISLPSQGRVSILIYLMVQIQTGGKSLDLGYHHKVIIPYMFQERGIVRRYLDNLEGALEDLDQALKEGGNEYRCLKHRGFVKYKLGDVEGARKDADRASTIRPTKPNDGSAHCLGDQLVEFLEYRL